MKNKLKGILDKSGKHQSVSFKNKEKRITFDETLIKKKMEITNKLIGGNSKVLSRKLQGN